MRTNQVETKVQQFWQASLAWKGDGRFTGNKTYGTLLQELTPLVEQPLSRALSTQADELAMLVVHAKRRRKKIAGKNKVTQLRLKLVTNNSVPSVKTEAA